MNKKAYYGQFGGQYVEIPTKLQEFMKGTKQSIPMEKAFESFKGYLMKE